MIKSDDPALRFEILLRIGRWILPAYRFKWPQQKWWGDVQFNKYLERFNEREGKNTDRRWMVYQLMRLTENVPGDTAECGIFQGAGSYLICMVNRENKAQHRIHHMFDSFEGMSKPSAQDGSHWQAGDLSCGLETVEKNLSDFENFRIYKGWIPDTFSEIDDKTFCFVHIDVDLYQPTLDSMTFFYPKMNKGGIIVCDDYGFTSCPGATEAVDTFLKDKDEKMVSLSGGGGFIHIGTKTSETIIT